METSVDFPYMILLISGGHCLLGIAQVNIQIFVNKVFQAGLQIPYIFIRILGSANGNSNSGPALLNADLKYDS